MNENNVEKNQSVEIDLQRLIGALLEKIWMIVALTVLGAVVAGVISIYFITPQYKAAAKFYVNNNDLSVGDLTINNNDLVTSRGLVTSYIVILKTRESLTDIIDYAGVDRSVSQVRGMISASAVDETEIFEVVVTSPDPQEAERIANAIAYILPKRITSIIEGTSAKVVEHAVVPTAPSSPNHTTNILIGFLVGLLLSAGVVVIREIFDVTIRSEDDIAQTCKHPILAAVPDMAAPSKGGYYYGYGNHRKKSSKNPQNSSEKQTVLIGSGISFSASEAYKLLRTKLQFSFAGEHTCRVIGVSSALSGEGKSLSAVNLAYTLSQLNKKVLLIDCDMRRPSIAEKLGIIKGQGLSSYLSGQIKLDNLIQKCGIPGEEEAFSVISAGRTPPNPGELLSSERMTKMIDHLREHYDYVILDFPPVGEVSDAMAVAKQVDGMLLVVRQSYCNRLVLSAAVRQFEFINSRILGIVYNCTSEGGIGYKGYYKRYYKRYYGRYGHHRSYYASAQKRAAEEAKAATENDVQA